MLDLELLRRLETAEGETVLRAAAERHPTEGSFLAESQHLARRYPERLARAAVEQAILRRRARAKFEDADRMFFLREPLEQATAEPVARHRARRFAGAPWIVDLGCGIGGDTLALSTAGSVLAVDRDPLRLAVLQANARALGRMDTVRPILADLLRPCWRPPRSSLAFADPSRRAEARRVRSGGASDPPLGRVMSILDDFDGGAVKLSPAVDRQELAALPAELEFVSLDGDLKEAILWVGRLRGGVRRATVLPDGASLAGDIEPDVGVGPIQGYLLQPDPAVLRAHLVRTLAARLGALLIDSEIALLTVPTPMDTPFVRTFKVLETLPAGLKALRQTLRARGIGQVTLMKRGSSVDAEAFHQGLRLGDGEEATVLLTRAAGRHVALLLRAVPTNRSRSSPGLDAKKE